MAAVDVADGQQEASQQQQAAVYGHGMGSHAVAAADSGMAAVDVADGQQEAGQLVSSALHPQVSAIAADMEDLVNYIGPPRLRGHSV